jgi:hypothetical protein
MDMVVVRLEIVMPPLLFNEGTNLLFETTIGLNPSPFFDYLSAPLQQLPIGISLDVF